MPYADDPMMTPNGQGVSDLTKCLSVTAPTVVSPSSERQEVSWTPGLPWLQTLHSSILRNTALVK